MAELRIGHDQVTLSLTGPVKFNKGRIWFTAAGYGNPEKIKKLTGTQPLVLVGDDGEIVATWHNDLTENFAVVRDHPKEWFSIEHDWTIQSINLT